MPIHRAEALLAFQNARYRFWHLAEIDAALSMSALGG